MKTKIPIICFILTLLGGVLHAQEKEIYTLEEAIKTALDNNLSVQRSSYDTQLFEEKVTEVRRSALPQVSLSASHNYYFELPTQVAPAGVFGGSETGASYLPLQLGVPNQTNLNLQLQQVIFNPELYVGIQAAKTGREISEIQLKKTKEDLVYDLSVMYYNSQAVFTQISLLKENLTSLHELIRVTQLLEEAGLAKETDIGRIKLNQSNLENNIVNQQIVYDQQLNTLKLLLNLPAEASFQIDTLIDVESNEFYAVTEEGVRTELQLLDKQEKVNQLEQKQIRSRYLPTLYAVGSYGQAGFGDFSADYYEFFPSSYVGVQLSMPLFDGFIKRSQSVQKDIEHKQLQADIELTRRSIKNELTNATAKFNVQKNEVQVQKEALALAQNVYDNINLQFREGTVGVQEVIESENELRRTQTDYLNAWIRLRLAELDLAKAKGVLLD